MTRVCTIAAVLCILLLVAAGCAPTLPPEEPWEKDARALLAQAETLFAKKQHDQASRVLDSFFATYPKSRQTDHALNLAGEMRFAVRDYHRALSYYKEIIEKYPSSTFIYEAKYKLGVCYYEIGEFDLAIANLEDRSRISDPVKLRRISEILSSAYLAKKSYLPAIKEFLYLGESAQTEPQRAGYRSRIREIVDKNLGEDELIALMKGKAYPSDVAHLRLTGLLIEQRKYRDAVEKSREFLEKFPAHPERTKALMLLLRRPRCCPRPATSFRSSCRSRVSLPSSATAC
jgi:tetratricopeptide (TPR) repeat protein